MSGWVIYHDDVLDRLGRMPDGSVQCCVTSPPYWGLRDYGEPAQIGLEETPEEFIEKMVEVFGAVRRVLRDDGTLWLNLGDSYNAAGRQGHGTREGFKQGTNRAAASGDDTNRPTDPSLKPKDLCGIPWRVALALRADGWYLRSDIIWSKPNPMPESVTDRPTKSHEYVFLMTKSQRYFYDLIAIKRPASGVSGGLCFGGMKKGKALREQGIRVAGREFDQSDRDRYMTSGGNSHTVWQIPTQSYKEAHFATYPEKLVEPCIKAGTSERGCCPQCGAPWARVVERDRQPTRPGNNNVNDETGMATTTTGWRPGCDCAESCLSSDENPEGMHIPDPVPCTVLDPFTGSGTTGVVACKHGRRFVGIELNAEYIKLAEKRIGKALQPGTYRDMNNHDGPLFKGLTP